MSPIRNFVPIASLVLGIVFAIILDKVFPDRSIIFYPATLLGIPCIVGGLLLMVWSISIFVRKKTDVRPGGLPTVLLFEGPYKYSRNPIYSGNMLILLGTAILIGSLTPFIVIPVYFVIIRTAIIPFEEQTLTAVFDQSYHEYQKKVRRWI